MFGKAVLDLRGSRQKQFARPILILERPAWKLMSSLKSRGVSFDDVCLQRSNNPTVINLGLGFMTLMCNKK